MLLALEAVSPGSSAEEAPGGERLPLVIGRKGETESEREKQLKVMHWCCHLQDECRVTEAMRSSWVSLSLLGTSTAAQGPQLQIEYLDLHGS